MSRLQPRRRAIELGLLLVAGVAFLAQPTPSGAARGAKHPLTNELDPAFATLGVKTLAALPFYTDISESDDPDRVAPSLSQAKFYQSLNTESGFHVSVEEVQRIIEAEKLQKEMESFYKKWTSDQDDIKADFIKKVAASLKVDAVVVGVVDVWYQQPIDITESGSARTAVGMIIGLFDGASGKRLWLGRDEFYKEGVRHTAQEASNDAQRKQMRGEMERTNLRTAGGVYAPPDYAEVVDLVVGSLVQAFPKRVK